MGSIDFAHVESLGKDLVWSQVTTPGYQAIDHICFQPSRQITGYVCLPLKELPMCLTFLCPLMLICEHNNPSTPLCTWMTLPSYIASLT